jgi:hypothetical protein
MDTRKNIIIYFIIIIIIIIILISYYIWNYNTKINKISNKYENRLINLLNNKLINDNEKKLFLIPIFELGDSIILNGAIRYFSNKYKNIIYVCKKTNYNFISYMYRDLDNIIYYIIPNKSTKSYINYYIPINDNIIKIFNNKNITYINMHNNLSISGDFIKRTYKILELSNDIAYNYFKIVRNYEREDILYNKLIEIIGDKYIILIDDEKRNFMINKKYLKNKNYPIFNISKNSSNKNIKLELIKSDNLFDYIKILENAVEIISIDTSIPWLIDMMNINVKTSIYPARQDTIIYKNKNIKKLNLFLKEILETNLNINNYIIKDNYEKLISYII